MALTSRQHTRGHAGHHHGHNHDTSYLTSANRNDAGVRITRVGLYVNLGMAIGKGIGGYVFHSQALTADAVHSLTDLVSDLLTLATVSLALSPPSARFPLGRGKVESLGALGVSSLLLLGGLGIGAAALADLLHVVAPALAHTLAAALGFLHVHSHGVAVPGLGAAWLAGASVVVKEWLYRATMKVAAERRSAVLKSNAMHHRVDSLTGLAALASVAVANLWPGFAAADALAGLAIAAMVVRAGWGNTGAALRELADSSVEASVLDRVRAAAVAALEAGFKGDGRAGLAPGPKGEPAEAVVPVVRGVRAVRAGQNLLVDVEVVLEPHVTVARAGEMEEAVRERVAGEVRGVRLVRVRFVPMGDADGAVERRPGFEGEWVEARRGDETEKGRWRPKEREQ